MLRVHATCVSIDGYGLLITGPSGCGKSDLALRLIEGGALLVADDQVEVSADNNRLIARCPAPIRGLIEARYAGPLPAPHTEQAVLLATLESADAAQLERVPLPAKHTLLGLTLPLLRLPYLEASAPAKVRLWLKTLTRHDGLSSSPAWPAQG